MNAPLKSFKSNQDGHGGRREGAGRKAGSTTTRTREIADAAMAAGITPLEYMLSILRDEQADKSQRFEAAKAAAPYVHPRLAITQNTIRTAPDVVELGDDWP